MQGVSVFRFRTPEQRVKVVDFDVCQYAPKLIGCHSNVPWATSFFETRCIKFSSAVYYTFRLSARLGVREVGAEILSCNIRADGLAER